MFSGRQFHSPRGQSKVFLGTHDLDVREGAGLSQYLGSSPQHM